ncbi:hypothetical protein Mboo_1165 [Methanoregula boonei 6A8]|jgi:uncharacterized membrane protein HdeD (DUF308 family)|uniref:DUF308 domain-containing protein n=1 Tax=Methanoregula boonei (strain DSM 21154 / JCM 14090 / 6A8) TaxID=456442 RepID=A7I7H2_METB6|nr:DUF308 domain-containing protein [Methanoregula boonei]ABS55683.1 hypothetical protein Mboo_1165 [Methanoregula boonei 6A8]
MDAKTSCLLKGLAGVIFGGLALVVPGPLLAFFTGIILILLITGMVLSILIAISSSAEESFFWFLCAVGLLIVGIVDLLFPDSVSLIFALAIAGLAFYAGYTGVAFALTRPQTKWYLVGSVAAASVILFSVFLIYVPSMQSHLVMTVVGTIALVLGLFAILTGITVKNSEELPPSPRTLILSRIKINPANKPEEKSGDQVSK